MGSLNNVYLRRDSTTFRTVSCHFKYLLSVIVKTCWLKHLLICSSANSQNYLGAWSFRDGAHISIAHAHCVTSDHHPHNGKNAARVQTNLKVTFLVKYLHYNVDIRRCCPKQASKWFAMNEEIPEPNKAFTRLSGLVVVRIWWSLASIISMSK